MPATSAFNPLQIAALFGGVGGGLGGLPSPPQGMPIDPEHEAEIARSQAFSQAVNRASGMGTTPVREAVYDEIARDFPERAMPVGTVLIGGGEPGYTPRRKRQSGSLGSLSARIAGVGPAFDLPATVEPPLRPRSTAHHSRKLPELPDAIVARMQAGENVSPKERQRAYKYLAYRQKMEEQEANRNATIAAAAAGFDTGRTQRMFRTAVMNGDMRGAQALLMARQQEIAQESLRDEASNRGRALDLQGRRIDLDYDLGMEGIDLRREGLGIDRERLGVAREDIAARERNMARQTESLSKRDAARMMFERSMANQSFAERLALGQMGFDQQRELAAADRAARREDAQVSAEASLRDRILQAYAGASPADRASLLRDLPTLRSIQRGELPAASTQGGPATLRRKLQREMPELLEEWDTRSGDKSALDFLMGTPTADIRNNREALLSYMEDRYPAEDLDFALRSYSTFFPSSIRQITDRREALGYGGGYMPFVSSATKPR